MSACLGGRQPLGASSVKLDFIQRFTPVGPVPCEEPKEMTLEDIEDTIADHVHSAKCAIEAGFDGVEIVSSTSPRASKQDCSLRWWTLTDIEPASLFSNA